MISRVLEGFSEENRRFMLATAAGFVITSAVIMAIGVGPGDSSTSRDPESNLTEVTFSGGDVEKSSLMVEVADTDKERRKGLMFREELGENRGMLFTWPGEENRSFWMKNTLIPLEIIFIDRERRIINIEEAYPQPGASNSELKRYRSEEPARYVIEANINYTDRNEILENDTVSFSLR